VAKSQPKPKAVLKPQPKPQPKAVWKPRREQARGSSVYSSAVYNQKTALDGAGDFDDEDDDVIEAGTMASTWLPTEAERYVEDSPSADEEHAPQHTEKNYFVSSYGIHVQSTTKTRSLPYSKRPSLHPRPTARCDTNRELEAAPKTPTQAPMGTIRIAADSDVDEYDEHHWQSQNKYDHHWKSHDTYDDHHWKSHDTYDERDWKSHDKYDDRKWQSHDKYDDHHWQSHDKYKDHHWQSHDNKYDERDWQSHDKYGDHHWQSHDTYDEHRVRPSPTPPSEPPPAHLQEPQQEQRKNKVPAGALWQAVRCIKEIGSTIEQLASRDDVAVPTPQEAYASFHETKELAKRVTEQFRDAHFERLQAFLDSRDGAAFSAQLIGLGKGSGHRAA
jgi:hypothetical protein